MDVTFEVQGDTISAHRLVLAARSPVFKAELFGPMKERTMSHIRIVDMDPRVFKAMIHFIYTDTLPEMDKDDTMVMAQHLVVAADRRHKTLHNMALATSSPTVATGGTSTSAITAATVTGSHVLRINGYSRTRGLGVRRYIESSKFLVAGHTWIIRYHPNGWSQEYADSISLFLFHCGRRGVRTQFTFSLHDPEGSHVQVHSQTTRCPVSLDPASRPSWGFPNFIKREDFEKSKYLRDDRFAIVCDIVVINGFYNGATDKLVDAMPPSDLHQDLGWLLETGDGADVKFKVDDKLFFAHKGVVAARSSVFRAELFGPMKGVSVKDVVEIHDMEPEVFMAMLKFMYTDLVPIMRVGEEIAMAQHLLVAADMYDLKRLKLICENKLCSRLTKKTALTTLVLAEQHGCHGLKKACFAFLSSLGSLKAAMGCDGYDHLRSSCPSLHDELVSKLDGSKGNKSRSFWCFSPK
ncbi:hypothetical protein HU200_044060 [Digitaria exilis]|uniref:Uncharacterized protein n=1 Tax=Digitaria exilis TaxID=1010633 RepID=A0A835B803_9POAL|nr:hypothetical protein HU200_044060 [Digitaria exilis]